ncbi:VRR-NUC domain-containing protein [Paeniglutamicibacter sp. R2-26]|uniref:VRR-NUC domain-containing protein n=1 Tax=Paeniglutamicibacter sp. R2-26 TaxID=3144417 RepID=UPI003EE70AF5
MSTGGFVSPVLSWSEKEFQDQVVEAAKALGWLVYHTHDSRRSEPGFPDLVLVHERKKTVLYRELKTQKGKASVDQEKWLRVLSAVGSDAGLWRPEQWLSRQIHSELSGGARV